MMCLANGAEPSWDLLNLIRKAEPKPSLMIWQQRFKNLFEKSRLTREINKAVFKSTLPWWARSCRTWDGVPTNDQGCLPSGYMLCDGGYLNKGEIDNENRIKTYGRVPVRLL